MPLYATTLPFFRDRALTDPPLPQGRWTSAYGSIDGLNRYLIEVERLLRQGDPSGELTKLYTARWAKTRGDSILTHAVFEEYRSLLAYRVSSAIQGVLEVSGDAGPYLLAQAYHFVEVSRADRAIGLERVSGLHSALAREPARPSSASLLGAPSATDGNMET